MEGKIPKTIVIGSQGFVGSRLARAYRRENPHTVCTHYSPLPGEYKLDLKSPSFKNLNFDGFEYGIIASALPNIAFCEKNPKESFQVNVAGTLEVVEFLKNQGIFPVVFSSDYVFDGKRGMYTELSETSPLNEYGRQKQALESGMEKLCGKEHLTLRLGKVYDMEKNDRTLLGEMALALATGKKIRVAFDQIFSPIPVQDVVACIIELQKAKEKGLFNLCGEASLARLDLAHKICQEMQGQTHLIEGISLDDLPEQFKRPKNTSMSCAKLLEKIPVKLSSLTENIAKIAKHYKLETV